MDDLSGPERDEPLDDPFVTPGLRAVRRVEYAAALAAQGRHAEALTAYDDALRYVELVRAGGGHDERRWIRMTSAAAPPPELGDVDLGALQARIELSRADSLLRLGRPEEAAAAAARAEPLVAGFGRRGLRKELRRVQQELAAAAGDPVARLQQLDERLRGRGLDRHEALVLRLERADLYLEAGRTDDALREALLVVRDGKEDTDAYVVASARQLTGLALDRAGRPAEALPSLLAAYGDLHRLGYHHDVLAMASPLSWRLSEAGRHDEAVVVLDGALHSARALADRRSEAALGAARAATLDRAGDATAAAQGFRAALELAERAGDPVLTADVGHGLAVVLATRFSDDPAEVVEALSVLDRAKNTYREQGLGGRVAGCEHEAAALLGRKGSYPAAAARYEAAQAAYLGVEEADRDAGAWPDELADVQRNLAALRAGGLRPAPATDDAAAEILGTSAIEVTTAASDRNGEAAASSATVTGVAAATLEGLFASGGHTMRHNGT
ncbi:MAG: hypothetical protein EPO13_04350 [Actinomycetota bacterium]|nr:MAG: hypothetical protein EPO13_04350 [Actinomycetota bacterium]